MKLLLIAATAAEIKPLLSYLGLKNIGEGVIQKKKIGKYNLSILVTGVGMTATAYNMGRAFATAKFDLAINAGIAGSFLKNIPLGSTVNITEELFADLGAEDDARFIDLFEIGLLNKNQPPFKNGSLKNTLSTTLVSIKKLKKVKGISVNKVHGNTKNILNIMKKYSPAIESMEGAAFHYACLKEKINYTEIRCVSNYVEKRDRSKWNIPLAVKNLNDFLIELLQEK
jgi:futalosine hydrolase